MHSSDQLGGTPVVERRRLSTDDPPLTTLASLPALRVLDQLPVPILAVARDGIIVYANEAFAVMLGYDETALSTLTFEDVFQTVARTECAVSVIREFADELVELSHADGSIVRAIMSRSALQRADDAMALITFQDVTEKLWLEGR